MALNYDDWKKQYEAMDTASQQKFATSMANNDTAKQYMQQYVDEKNGTNSGVKPEQKTTTVDNNTTQTTNGSDFNSSNGTNGQNSTLNNNKTIEERRKDESSLINERRDTTNTTDKTVSGDFKSEKIGENNGISVKEGDASITGLPDYQDDSAARLNEIASNLNSYYQTNKEFFNNRDTFNKVFNYSGRSQTQRDLLDSYWRKVEDTNYVNGLTSPDAVMNALDNGELTPSMSDVLKEGNPALYAQWQKAIQDKVDQMIANLAVPTNVYDLTNTLNDVVNKLGLQAGDPYDIIGTWRARAESLGVFRDGDTLNSYISQMQQVSSERTAAMTRVMKEGAGRKSQSLINAEVAKTSALYDAKFSDLAQMFNSTYQKRQQNLAIANQEAQVLQAQAQEDQRIFNNKITGLNMAMNIYSYRTPEQQAQLQLQTKAITNELDLLNQSKKNDLNLYNQRQLNDLALEYKQKEFEMDQALEYSKTDLTSTDPYKQRIALSNILDDYYEKYGDIIKRSKEEVIDDVLAYAEKNNCSLAEALRKNFIEPLQGKSEYQAKVKDDYGMNVKQTISKIGDRNVILTQNPDGTISFKYINDDGGITNYATLEEGLNGFMAGINYGKGGGGQCGEFVNKYMKGLGLSTRVGNSYDSKKAIVNSSVPTRGSIAVMPSKNFPDYGHVAIVTGVNSDGTVNIIESNWDNDKTVHVRNNVNPDTIYGYYTPNAAGMTDTSLTTDPSFEWQGTTYDLSKYSEWGTLTDTEKELVKGLLSYSIDPNSLPKSGQDNGKSTAKVKAAANAIGRDLGYTEQKYNTSLKVKNKWELSQQAGGEASRNSTAVSVLKSIYDSYDELENGGVQAINGLVNWFYSQTGSEKTLETEAEIAVAASEMAGALKGNASPATEEIKGMKDLLSTKLTTGQAKATIKMLVKAAFDKNESEAMAYYNAIGAKPESIWVSDVSDRMYNDLGLDLTRYYNYQGVTEEDIASKYFSNFKTVTPTISFGTGFDFDSGVNSILNIK